MGSSIVRIAFVVATAIVMAASPLRFVAQAFRPAFGTVAAAQETEKTVADGVYTDAQAARGATVYEASCAGCHRADLGGATGPALRDQRFTRQFAGKELKALFTKAATTMPRNAPGTLGDDAYLDIVAHLLKENGFPSGPQELSADAGTAEAAASRRRLLVRRSGGLPHRRFSRQLVADTRERAGRSVRSRIRIIDGFCDDSAARHRNVSSVGCDGLRAGDA